MRLENGFLFAPLYVSVVGLDAEAPFAIRTLLGHGLLANASLPDIFADRALTTSTATATPSP